MPKKKTFREHWYVLAATFVIIVIIYFSLKLPLSDASGEGIDRRNCPYKTEGNTSAEFGIKYVDSPYCFYCWIEEPILKRIVKGKGKSFWLERYDIRYCTKMVRKYGFAGTPSFVFSINNGTREYSHTGFIEEITFYRIICETTGNCYVD